MPSRRRTTALKPKRTPTSRVSGSRLDELVLHRLQALDEEALNREFIIPLFQALPFDSVDYHGGPGELRKDLVCWRNDPIDGPTLTVVQIKCIAPSARAATKSSLAGLVNQLGQAFDARVPSADDGNL